MDYSIYLRLPSNQPQAMYTITDGKLPGGSAQLLKPRVIKGRLPCERLQPEAQPQPTRARQLLSGLQLRTGRSMPARPTATPTANEVGGVRLQRERVGCDRDAPVW